MKLYFTPGACSLAPHIVAREAGLDFELAKVDLAAKTLEDGSDYLAVNPKGSVPALALDEGLVLTEAAVLVQYLADRAPAANLLPAAGTIERYVAQEWLNFIATELHKGFGPLWKKDTPAEVRESTKAVLATKFAYLDRILAERPHLTGESFSAADAYAFTVLSWAKFMAIDLGRWTHLTAYLARVGARPKVREALIAEGLLSADEAA
ncbi:MAG TPA: glutathione transferase GstA [Allosphingosinicella sp.]|jgi:glutathione S-transferase